MKTFTHALARLFLFIACIVSPLMGFADCFEHDHAECQIEKRYIEAKDILFDQQAIYVRIDQNWQRTGAILSDENGLYIELQGPWTCDNCKRINRDNPYTCEYCGRRRG